MVSSPLWGSEFIHLVLLFPGVGPEKCPPVEPGLGESSPLEKDVLAALGSCSSSAPKWGPPVLEEIVRRFDPVLVEGLPAESRAALELKFQVPANAGLLAAPRLNLEIRGTLSSSSVGRDAVLESFQSAVGHCGAGILLALEGLSVRPGDRLEAISSLSDALRLLCDAHFAVTQERQRAVLPHLARELHDQLAHSSRDEFLFGSSFSESVRQAAASKKLSEQIRKPADRRRSTPQGSGNARAPVRRTRRTGAAPQQRFRQRPQSAWGRRGPPRRQKAPTQTAQQK